MSTSSFLLVLSAAVLHALWNMLVKSGADRLISAWAVTASSALVSGIILIIAGLPDRRVWWLIALSSVVHTAYILVLVRAYSRAGLSVAYPIARGTAPGLVAIAGNVLLGDDLSVLGAVGVAIIIGGLATLAIGRPMRHMHWAAATGVVIATYSVIDGYGVRLGGESVRYIAAGFVGHAAMLTLIVLHKRSWRAMGAYVQVQPIRLLAGGAAAASAYLFVMIAARTEPLGLVSGLRETSGFFGLLMGRFLLGEHVTRRQTVAVLLAACGAIAVALS